MIYAVAGNVGEHESPGVAERPTTYPPLLQRPSPTFRPPGPSSPVYSDAIAPASGFRRVFSNAKRHIPTSPSSSVVGWLYERMQTQTINLLSFHPVFLPLLLLIFLLLPIYYSSKANAIYKDNDGNQYLHDFREWTRRSLQRSQSSSSNAHASGTNPNGTPGWNAAQPAVSSCTLNPDIVCADTEHSIHNVTFSSITIQPSQPPNIPEGSPTVVAMQSQPAIPSASVTFPHSVPPHSAIPAVPLPNSLLTLHCAWLAYIHSCVYGWRVSFAVAGFLFCTSPTIFQIQNATDDPLPRTFAFLAVFRAIVGIVYSPVFLCYFGEGSRTRSVQFAVLWMRETRARGGGMKWGPWIMLSLPGSATLWAIILYSLSMLAFMWRVVSSAKDKEEHTPLSKPAMISLCSVLTAATVLDIVGGVWAWRRMAWFKQELHRMQHQALDA